MKIKIELIAKEMARKYKEDELKWILVLKRLEKQGYSIELKDDSICRH